MRVVDIEGTVHHQTAKAILFSTDGVRGEAVWVPKSVAELEQEGAHWVLTIPENLAIEKGLV